MAQQHPQSPRFDLAPRGMGAMPVDLEAFFEFSFELAEDLEEMVAKHRDVPQFNKKQRIASPNLNAH